MFGVKGRTSGGLFIGVSLGALASAMGVLAAGPAHAQEATAQAQTDETIVVRGFRGSLQRALNVKRDSGVASDVILAEDIGKFPDLNLSEAIQRIPGVALARDGGEGRQIAVRGLGAQFTRVRINGMEAMATTGGADATGGANRGRSFDFNVFASDLFNSISVLKTAEAAQEEGSLGATVDLRTARPFDFDGFRFVLAGQADRNELAGTVGPRVTALWSNTWLDGRLGLLVTGAHASRDTIEEGSSTVRWATNKSFTPGFESAPVGGPTLAALNAAFHPRFPRYDHYDNHNERTGFTASLQWRPTDNDLVSFDALYADFAATRREFYLEAPSFSTGSACTVANRPNNCGLADFNVTSATITPDNVLVKGTFNDVDIRMENRYDTLDTVFRQLTLEAEHHFGDVASVHAYVGHSSSAFDNPFQTTLTFDKFNIQNYAYDYTDSRHPLLSYGSMDPLDPAGWVLRELRERKLTVDNTYDTARLEAEWNVTDAFRLTGGLNYRAYTFDTTELRRVDAAGSTANVEVFTPAQVAQLNAIAPLSSYSSVARLNGQGLDIPAGTPTAWIVPNLEAAYRIFDINNQSALGGLFRLGPQPALTNNKSVAEIDNSAFLEASWNLELLGMPVRGNLGARYIETHQKAGGYTFVAGSAVPLIAERDYSDTLPSFNLSIEPMENLLIRFGAAKVLSRPDMTQLSPGAAFNVAGSTRGVTAGNPSLDPFRATTYDIAAEWYFAPGGLLSVALFEKDISSFSQVIVTNQTFQNNPFGLPDSAAIAACGNQTTDCNVTTTSWSFTAPVNTPGSDLAGYEINYQQALRFLPGFLGNLGILLNYTNVAAKVDYLDATGAVAAHAALVNLSPTSYNATLYYEDEHLSARVSTAFRERYLGIVPGVDTRPDAPIPYQGNNSTLNVDASAQYTINEHLKFTFEGINLTDQFQDQFIGTQNMESVYHHTGRDFIFGFRYTY